MRSSPAHHLRRKLAIRRSPVGHSHGASTTPVTQERTVGQRVDVRLQTVAIIAAGFWALYTFIYEKIWLPSVTPINVTVQLDLVAKNPVGARAPERTASDSFIAIEMRLAATNPTTRRIHLLRGHWTAYGCTIGASDGLADDSASRARVAKMINDRSGFHESRHGAATSCTLVAIGSIWQDETLQPQETLRPTRIFYVPTGRYDYLDVYAAVPCAADVRTVDLEWKVDSGWALHPVFLRPGPVLGAWRPIEQDSAGGDDVPPSQLQQAVGWSQISLRS